MRLKDFLRGGFEAMYADDGKKECYIYALDERGHVYDEIRTNVRYAVKVLSEVYTEKCGYPRTATIRDLHIRG